MQHGYWIHLTFVTRKHLDDSVQIWGRELSRRIERAFRHFFSGCKQISWTKLDVRVLERNYELYLLIIGYRRWCGSQWRTEESKDGRCSCQLLGVLFLPLHMVTESILSHVERTERTMTHYSDSARHRKWNLVLAWSPNITSLVQRDCFAWEALFKVSITFLGYLWIRVRIVPQGAEATQDSSDEGRMISTKPVLLNAAFPICDNLDSDSNLTEESDPNSKCGIHWN